MPPRQDLLVTSAVPAHPLGASFLWLTRKENPIELMPRRRRCRACQFGGDLGRRSARPLQPADSCAIRASRRAMTSGVFFPLAGAPDAPHAVEVDIAPTLRGPAGSMASRRCAGRRLAQPLQGEHPARSSAGIRSGRGRPSPGVAQQAARARICRDRFSRPSPTSLRRASWAPNCPTPRLKPWPAPG